MHYLGGKFRIVDRLVPALDAVRLPGQSYLEPFMGACHVLSRIRGTRTGGDVLEDLVLMWQGVRDGTFIPPTFVSEEEYRLLRDAPPSALRGFAGIGLGYGGTFFGGYSRAAKQTLSDPESRVWKEDSYCLAARKSLLAIRPALQGVTLKYCSYDQHDPHGCQVYADPPYFKTSKYKGTSDFDHLKFWELMRKWSADNTVLVSEYQAPEDWEPVWAVNTKTSMRVKDSSSPVGKADPRRESLFIWKDAPDFKRVKSILQEGALFFGGISAES